MKTNHSSHLYPAAIALAALLLISVADAAFAASGGGYGSHWQSTDTFRIINFLVLAGLVFFLLRKPAAQFLGDRIKGIQEQLKELEQKKIEAEKKLAEYTRRLADLSAESDQIIDEYRRQGESMRENILKAAETAAAKLESQARRNIEHEFKKARVELEMEIMEKAISRAETMLEKNITDKDQERLVGEYLDKVVIK
ncbi:MAG: ATP synthase F0 subunit B [Desulfobacteraceae bacterium]|jgi:F-type H+-transporting ATPase subunit b|nr:MAG: ATP synthase F0 subunit B [Desulfobacteraceae bacterium]